MKILQRILTICFQENRSIFLLKTCLWSELFSSKFQLSQLNMPHRESSSVSPPQHSHTAKRNVRTLAEYSGKHSTWEPNIHLGTKGNTNRLILRSSSWIRREFSSNHWPNLKVNTLIKFIVNFPSSKAGLVLKIIQGCQMPRHYTNIIVTLFKTN